MQVKTTDLPGVGKMVSLFTAEGSKLVLIIHHSGKREIYFFEDADEDEADFCVGLSDEETRQLGAQLLGVDYQPVSLEKMKLFQKQLVMEWIELKDTSPLANKSIGDSKIRSKTGASIVAIIRSDDMIVSPDVTEVLKPADTLMACGRSEQIKAFEALCNGEEKS